MKIVTPLICSAFTLFSLTSAQQYAGDFINNSLPQVPGAEITYFRIPDPAGKNNNLTLINYYSWNSTGQRIVESKIQRAVIVVHGLNRDPGTYESNALSALYQVVDPNINFDTVAVIAPYFPNGDDKNYGYPWTTGLAAGLGSTTNALVWPGSQWSAGGNAQYPNAQKNTISSYYVLDTLVKYFDNATLFPNVKQIVVAGHSLGAQTVQRYAAIGNQLNTRSPVTYWVANPNSYAWLNTTRPFDTSSCPIYDVYREGYTNFTLYPMTYATSLVAQGRTAILANFNSKGVAYARGLQDLGDDSSSCAPFTTGGDRNERFFNFIKAFPPACSDPTSRSCDTIDFVNVGHDSGQMMASSAGQARLFIDNFYGDKKRAFDFGYPRIQAGDDPFPDPSLNSTVASFNNNTYAGNMTYYGCYSDQNPPTLPYFAFDNSSTTIEFCTQACNALNYSIAGLEYGSQCFCGNALSAKAQRVVESSCSFACASNTNETCGGFSRISIFSRGSPAQLAPPNDPDTIGNWTFWNCYTEGTNVRALSDNSMTSNTLTLDSCAAFCKNYKYFGTEYGSECYCGNSFGIGANVTNKNDCNMLCSGNNLQLCGASYRLSVYMQPNFSPSASLSATAATATGTAAPSVAPAQCPDSNGTVVTTNGSRFLVECYVDRAGGDLMEQDVNSFQQCIDLCATTKGCIDVSLSGVACYMKSSLGNALQNLNIWGAKYIGAAPTSSIVSTIVSSSSKASTVSTTTPSTSSAVITSSVVTSPSPLSSSSLGSSSILVISSTAMATSAIITTSTQATIVSSSTSSASPSPTPITCPTSNNTVVTANGSSFIVECFVDRYGGDMGYVAADTFLQCITSCATNKGCVDVSLAGTSCYMKSQLGDPGSNNGVWGARYIGSAATFSSVITSSSKAATSSTVSTSSSSSSSSSSSVGTTSSVTTTSSAALSTSQPGSTAAVITSSSAITSSSQIPSSSSLIVSSSAVTAVTSSATPTPTIVTCPTSNNTIVTSTNGTSFLVECGIDHYGGDQGLFYYNSFLECINKCAATTGCVDVSLNGNACYLKSSLGSGNSNSGIWGAKLVANPVSSSSLLATSTAVLVSTSIGQSSSSPNPVVSSTAKTSSTTSTSSSSSISPAITSSSSTFATSTTSSAPAASSSSPSFSYLGCFIDGGNRALPVSLGTSSSQTPQQCALNCQSQGYKYSGTEYSSECWCSNTAPTSKAADSDCSSTCSGDAKQQCGGGYRLSVYVDNKWTQKLFARQSFKSWNLAGCYSDTAGSRTLPQTVDMPGGGSNATIANCLTACAAKGYTWCGAEYYSECYGSTVSPTTKAQPGSDALAAGCNYPCSGNSTEACGGANLITIYINNGTAS